MKGITIIEEHLCRVVDTPSLIGLGIAVTLLCGGIIALYGWLYKSDTISKSSKIMIRCCSVVVVIVYVALWAVLICKYNTTHMEYTVTIDDSVSFNDFYEKYEIVSVDGDRYRVKDTGNIN